VVGGGVAGIAASIAAARNGAKVILVEQRDILGGLASGGLVFMIRAMRHMRAPRNDAHEKVMRTSYESSYDDEQLVFSIAQEFVDRMRDVKAAYGTKGQSTTRQMFDPEMAKWVMERMVLEAGVDVWYYSQVTDLLLSGNSVEGVVIENLQERIEISSKVTIDATGDGDVCVAAGARFEKGDPETGKCQPMSLLFVIGGVNVDKTLDYIKNHPEEYPDESGQEFVNTLLRLRKEEKPIGIVVLKSKVREALKNGEYPIPYGMDDVKLGSLGFTARPSFRNGKFRYDHTIHNMDMAFNVDGTDRRQLTKATMAMREIAVKMTEFYRKYYPGYEDCYLMYTAQQVGIRDTRRIVCEYTLTKDDVASGRAFEDGIARYGSVMDIHDRWGKVPIMLAEVGGKGWFHIPYRIIVPRGVKNLLVAGRCVSADHTSLGCTRSQAACMLTGQAAGTAAALATRTGVEPRSINIADLQTVLRSQNQLI
jgi:hypothetical protein